MVDPDGRNRRHLRHGSTGNFGIQPADSGRDRVVCHVRRHRHSPTGSTRRIPAGTSKTPAIKPQPSGHRVCINALNASQLKSTGLGHALNGRPGERKLRANACIAAGHAAGVDGATTRARGSIRRTSNRPMPRLPRTRQTCRTRRSSSWIPSRFVPPLRPSPSPPAHPVAFRPPQGFTTDARFNAE